MSPISTFYSFVSKRGPDPTGGLPAPYARPFVDDKASFWFDIVLLSVFAVFVLAFLPRSIVRLCSRPNVLKGLILRGGGKTHPRIPRMSVYSHQENAMSSDTVVVMMEDVMGMDMDMTDDMHSIPEESDDSHTLHEHMSVPPMAVGGSQKPCFFHQAGSFFKHSASSSSYSPPFHFPTWTTIAYPIAKYANKSAGLGVSYGQIFLVVLYICGIVFVSGYYADPFSSVRRSGSLAMAQLPVIFALGAKNNLVGTLIGAGYEKVRACLIKSLNAADRVMIGQLNYYHRIVGITFLILAHLHVLPYS